MIDQLFNLIKENSQDAVFNNPAIPNEINESVISETHDSIINGLRGFSQEDLNSLAHDVETGNLENNSQLGFLNNNLSDNLMQKLGLNGTVAKTVGAILLPIILKKVLGGQSNNNSGGGFLNDILGSVMGGNSNTNNSNDGGIMDKISDIGKSFGLDKNGDGKVDLGDLGGFLK